VTDYEKIILELREENKKLREEIKLLQLLVNDLIKLNDELKQKLVYYENPHHLKIPYYTENKKQKKDNESHM